MSLFSAAPVRDVPDILINYSHLSYSPNKVNCVCHALKLKFHHITALYRITEPTALANGQDERIALTSAAACVYIAIRISGTEAPNIILFYMLP